VPDCLPYPHETFAARLVLDWVDSSERERAVLGFTVRDRNERPLPAVGVDSRELR